MSITSQVQPHATKTTRIVGWMAAGMMIVMLLAQLYGYEAFANILRDVLPSHDATQATIAAGMIVIVELLSLPYLIEMRLSALMRRVSIVFGLAIGGFWLLMPLTSAHAENSGLFSDTLELPGGVLALLWSLVLVGCSSYVVYKNSRPLSS